MLFNYATIKQLNYTIWESYFGLFLEALWDGLRH